MRTVGIVKWFNDGKGFGFILPEGGGGEVFVHYSHIQMEGHRTLIPGQAVEFEVLKTEKGLNACKVVPVVRGEV